MLIVHHTDADGHCAAAIIKNEIYTRGPLRFFPYNYKQDIAVGIIPNDIVYLVDISMSPTVEAFINSCLAVNCKVVHIDHHKTTSEWYHEHPKEWSLYTYFYTDEKISASMLCWIYACMTDEEKKHPMDVKFEFGCRIYTHMIDEERSHPLDTKFVNTTSIRGSIKFIDRNTSYSVPIGVRFIDDNDVWRHEINETKYFITSYNALDRDTKSPDNDEFWNDLLYHDNSELIRKMVDDGVLIYKYKIQTYKFAANRDGFVSDDLFDFPVFCLNATVGNSELFGDKIKEYPCLKFGYSNGIWYYTLYSSDECDDDILAIATSFGGGGHQHACGFQLPYCLFGGEKPNTVVTKTKKNIPWYKKIFNKKK